MTTLSIDAFPAFMQEATGFAPFPWQTRLLERVLSDPARPRWPSLLDLPTGTGKTSTLHVAVFAMALRPQVMPRRVVLVVDRRVIVDQVHRVAQRLAEHLANATEGVSLAVAEALRACCANPEAEPLRASLLRGGVPRDEAWVQSPEQPTLFASTVDQVGSRLLFRGYGVSPSMRPVHAGVLGTDTLYLLDEVHLATAFEKTLSDLQHYNGPQWREQSFGRPLQVVRMSATPRQAEGGESPFRLDDDDRAHGELRKRLEASRPAVLELVKTKSGADEQANGAQVANAASRAARQLSENGARLVGVVMNRVSRAVATAQKLRNARAGHVLLLTGRMRPFDRARVQAEIEAVAASGSDSCSEGPTFVVATSCIEAGADYDFDGLVTEVASLPALRQRFGRLNRLGEHPHAAARILGCKHQLSKSAKPDPIYGEALANTWRFLEANATESMIDFGLEAFPTADAETMEPLRTVDARPPSMFPNYLDLWSETRPAPHPSPDVALWLHGKDHDDDRDVSLVFRCDVTMPDSTEVDEPSAQVLEFLPPLTEEVLSVPRHQALAFIAEQATAAEPRVLRWSSDGASAVSPNAIDVGDVLVVPTSWGGLRLGSWDPKSTDTVQDVAEAVRLDRFRAGIGAPALFLRAHSDVLPPGYTVPAIPDASESEDPEAWDAAYARVNQWLAQPRDSEDWMATLLPVATEAQLEPTVTTDPTNKGWWVAWKQSARALRVSTEATISSFTGEEVGLTHHLEDVQAWAEGFATRAGLPVALAQDITLAAWLHDAGKADPRFQILLRNGDEVAAHVEPPLAKSRHSGAKQQRSSARARAGWPRGFRHELLSLALFDSVPSLVEQANDADLVRHLIASHHGWCRPWAPSTDDPNPIRVRFSLGAHTMEVETAVVDDTLRLESASRFHRLCQRYGWHGLAYLEALLRLGDHQASRAPKTRPKEARA